MKYDNVQVCYADDGEILVNLDGGVSAALFVSNACDTIIFLGWKALETFEDFAQGKSRTNHEQLLIQGEKYRLHSVSQNEGNLYFTFLGYKLKAIN